MLNKWAWCGCLQPLTFSKAIKNLIGDIGKLLISPGFEGASDVVFATGQLLGSVVGEKYISLPGDSLTISKFRNRMLSHQCIRNSRHLIKGKCPNEF